jgi:hypothetical protein
MPTYTYKQYPYQYAYTGRSMHGAICSHGAMHAAMAWDEEGKRLTLHSKNPIGTVI